jgi:hypothetical protein
MRLPRNHPLLQPRLDFRLHNESTTIHLKRPTRSQELGRSMHLPSGYQPYSSQITSSASISTAIDLFTKSVFCELGAGVGSLARHPPRKPEAMSKSFCWPGTHRHSIRAPHPTSLMVPLMSYPTTGPQTSPPSTRCTQMGST